MDLDATSLKRIKIFAEFLQKTKEVGIKPSFFTTPTEHGDNITAMVKYLSDAQQQWTLNEEPPSFNWGPYGLQNKSNLGN